MLFKHNINPTAFLSEIDSSHLSMGFSHPALPELSLLLVSLHLFSSFLVCLLNMSFPFVLLLNITLHSDTVIGTCLKK